MNTDNWEENQRTWHWAESARKSQERVKETFQTGTTRALVTGVVMAFLSAAGFWVLQVGEAMLKAKGGG